MSDIRKLSKKGVYETDKEKVGNLYNLRKEKGLTQDELCSALGITRTAYNSWENGSSKIKSDVLELLADYYHVSIDYLLGRSDCRSVENDYIKKITGLNELAIKKLYEWRHKTETEKLGWILSQIIINSHFFNVLEKITALYYDHILQILEVYYQEETTPHIISNSDNLDMEIDVCLFNASHNFMETLNDILFRKQFLKD